MNVRGETKKKRSRVSQLAEECQLRRADEPSSTGWIQNVYSRAIRWRPGPMSSAQKACQGRAPARY